jgi:hypothetical protein
MIPHEYDHGYDGYVSPDPIIYPTGFDDTVVS